MSLSSWNTQTAGSAPTFSLSTSSPISGVSDLAIVSSGTSAGTRTFINLDAGTTTTGYITTQFKFPSAISTDSMIGIFAAVQTTNTATPNAYYWMLKSNDLTQMILSKTGPAGTTLTTLSLGTTVATDGTVYAIGIRWDFRTNSILHLSFGTPNISATYGYTVLASTTYTDSSSPYGVTTNLGCGLIYHKTAGTSPQTTSIFDMTVIGDPTGRTHFDNLIAENWENILTEPVTVLITERWEFPVTEPTSLLTDERWES